MAGTEYVVKATDAASSVFAKIALSADGLDKQLGDLSKRVATPEVDLKDAKFAAGIIKAAERIDKLSAMVADPKIEIDSSKAQLEILRISAMLDRLDAKRVSVDVGVHRSLMSRLGGGIGGLGGLLGGAGGAVGGGVSALGQYGQGALYGIGGGLAAALGPALLPLGLGGLVGGGAALGALTLGAKGAPLLQADRQALARAQASLAGTKGPGSASQLLTLHLAQQKLARDQSRYGAFMPLNQAFSGLGQSALGTFAGALKSTGTGFSGAGPNQSFLTSLTGILKQVGGFVKSLGPQLGDLFRASVPFIQAFVTFLEKSGKILLPVFTQALKQMTPYLPMIVKGLVSIVRGLAGMITSLGPGGMKASAEIFLGLCKAMEFILPLVGKAMAGLAEGIMQASHFIRIEWPKVTAMFDDFRHRTAVIFDGVRHEIAHVWDMIFQNTIGRVIRGGHDIEREWNTWTHNIGVIFDTFRHAVATVWDTIWNNTIGRIKTGISDAVSWFRGLPGRVINAVEGLGTSLYNFGRMALTKMWNGLKSVFTDVWSWFKSLPGKLLNAIGIHSPPDWAIEAGKHIMGGLLHGITSRKDELLSRMQAISTGMGGVAGRFAVPSGGVPALAQRMAAAYGWAGQWGSINAVAMRESGWSMTARNQSSGAYGIAQFIQGPGEYYQYGGNPNTAAGQIIAFYNYMRQRYGTPAAAWQHELNFGWYDRGGWLPPGLSLALNNTGAPERVGGGPGNTYNIHVHVPPSANKADMGRQVVEVIREYEKRSGAGWRK